MEISDNFILFCPRLAGEAGKFFKSGDFLRHFFLEKVTLIYIDYKKNKEITTFYLDGIPACARLAIALAKRAGMTAEKRFPHAGVYPRESRRSRTTGGSGE